MFFVLHPFAFIVMLVGKLGLCAKKYPSKSIFVKIRNFFNNQIILIQKYDDFVTK